MSNWPSIRLHIAFLATLIFWNEPKMCILLRRGINNSSDLTVFTKHSITLAYTLTVFYCTVVVVKEITVTLNVLLLPTKLGKLVSFYHCLQLLMWANLLFQFLLPHYNPQTNGKLTLPYWITIFGKLINYLLLTTTHPLPGYHTWLPHDAVTHKHDNNHFINIDTRWLQSDTAALHERRRRKGSHQDHSWCSSGLH